MVTDSNLRLFHGINKRDEVERKANSTVSKVFRETSAEDLLDSSEEEFVEEVMSKVDMNIPDIDFEDWEADVKGTGGNRRLEIPLTYTGDADLLEITPKGYDSVNPIRTSGDGKRSFRPSVTRSRLTFSFNLSSIESGKANEEIEESLGEIEEGLGALQEDLEELKEGIREDIREKYQKRKKQAQENEDKLDELDIPIKNRDKD